MIGLHKMGSYAVYGGTGAAGVYVKQNAPETLTRSTEATPPLVGAEPASFEHEQAESILGDLFYYFQEEFVTVVDGRIYIGDVSALDIGSMVLITFSLAATLMKARYDYTDWKERRLARLKRQAKQIQEDSDVQTTALGGDDPPP